MYRLLKLLIVPIALCAAPGLSLAAPGCCEQQTSAQIESLQARASGGDEKAQMKLARMYLVGDGVATDFDKSIYYYRLVADRDIAFAQYTLARIFSDGIYIESDPQKALAWMLRAANLGYVPAQLDLSLLYEGGVGIAPDLVESYKWFVIATSLTDMPLDSRRAQLESKMSTLDLAHGAMLARFCMLGGYSDC